MHSWSEGQEVKPVVFNRKYYLRTFGDYPMETDKDQRASVHFYEVVPFAEFEGKALEYYEHRLNMSKGITPWHNWHGCIVYTFQSKRKLVMVGEEIIRKVTPIQELTLFTF